MIEHKCDKNDSGYYVIKDDDEWIVDYDGSTNDAGVYNIFYCPWCGKELDAKT